MPGDSVFGDFLLLGELDFSDKGDTKISVVIFGVRMLPKSNVVPSNVVENSDVSSFEENLTLLRFPILEVEADLIMLTVSFDFGVTSDELLRCFGFGVLKTSISLGVPISDIPDVSFDLEARRVGSGVDAEVMGFNGDAEADFLAVGNFVAGEGIISNGVKESALREFLKLFFGYGVAILVVERLADVSAFNPEN